MPIASLVNDITSRFGTKARWQRSFDRHAVCIPAGLRLESRSYDLMGVILELSQGGALFREASDFILDRNGAHAELKISGLHIPVTIVASRPKGYGVRFNEELSSEVIKDLVAEYGMSGNFR